MNPLIIHPDTVAAWRGAGWEKADPALFGMLMRGEIVEVSEVRVYTSPTATGTLLVASPPRPWWPPLRRTRPPMSFSPIHAAVVGAPE